jgi:hypothetical protein
MEKYRVPQPDELVGPDLGRAAVRLFVDDLFKRWDTETHRVLFGYVKLIRGEDDE